MAERPPGYDIKLTARRVWATVTREGWHRWPDAPDRRDYLRFRHRHLFHITVTVPVEHDDRHVEYHDLRDAVVRTWNPEQGRSSCEAIAYEVGAVVLATFPVEHVEVVVSEDGECGSTVRVTRGDV